jgi:hypothetical protein
MSPHEFGYAMRGEINALLWCVRRQLGSVPAQPPVFDSRFDWPSFLRLSDAHRILPIVYAALKHDWPGPVSVLERMRADVAGISLRSAALAREAVRLTRLLESGGVPAMVIKGPVLASIAYGNPALRQFGDIDLLVRPGDIVQAAELLRGNRYEGRSRAGPRAFQRLAVRQEQFTRPDHPGFVELHWRLMPSFFDYGPDEDEIWRRASSAPLADGHVLTLCDRDALLFLCAHGAKHGWPAMLLVADVAATIRGEIDWSGLIDDARAGSGLRILLLGLLLAHEIIGSDVPAEVLRMARNDRVVSACAACVGARLLSGDPRISPFGEAVFQFRMTEGFHRRVRYVYERGFKPTVNDRNFVRLPRPLNILYLAVRPFRLLFQALKH